MSESPPLIDRDAPAKDGQLTGEGHPQASTPNMDRLAAEGTRFTQFYSAASVCSPSRAALLTGKTNLRAGLRGNVPVPWYAEQRRNFGMPTEQVTIAEVLKEQGYYTALIGKWHLGHKPETLPNGQGFDYYFGHQGGCIDNYSHFMFWTCIKMSVRSTGLGSSFPI